MKKHLVFHIKKKRRLSVEHDQCSNFDWHEIHGAHEKGVCNGAHKLNRINKCADY